MLYLWAAECPKVNLFTSAVAVPRLRPASGAHGLSSTTHMGGPRSNLGVCRHRTYQSACSRQRHF
eukprot:3086026-Pyramimonas_sp.AAC.1